ncbi:hypothetical protein SUNDANCE_183 [Brevibacillus phage Sundance]|uniref:hypothetical protein n=1 Tax=Brevibacillus phage Sundance TaxID=1691958 RepID=UPI0006BDD710|nr:hypothetical protein AVT09_gp183 [Brevibacillus phage Sundance]ALA47999.1 hypothetical protein SUNDANCE_183 [Brevibacillus phage Sundance]
MEITITKKLEAIKSQSDNRLINRVIDDALNEGEDAQTWLEDVHTYGCVSGAVSGLVYYHDTHAFFLEYIEEIEKAFFEYIEQTSIQPKIPEGDIRNWFAWFGYECAVDQLLTKLENDDFIIEE